MKRYQNIFSLLLLVGLIGIFASGCQTSTSAAQTGPDQVATGTSMYNGGAVGVSTSIVEGKAQDGTLLLSPEVFDGQNFLSAVSIYRAGKDWKKRTEVEYFDVVHVKTSEKVIVGQMKTNAIGLDGNTVTDEKTGKVNIGSGQAVTSVIPYTFVWLVQTDATGNQQKKYFPHVTQPKYADDFHGFVAGVDYVGDSFDREGVFTGKIAFSNVGCLSDVLLLQKVYADNGYTVEIPSDLHDRGWSCDPAPKAVSGSYFIADKPGIPLFLFGKAEFTEQGFIEHQAAFDLFTSKNYGSPDLLIVGNTDVCNEGEFDNDELSLNRAKTGKKYFEYWGYTGRIEVAGNGSSKAPGVEHACTKEEKDEFSPFRNLEFLPLNHDPEVSRRQ